jgi:hypothetical protein
MPFLSKLAQSLLSQRFVAGRDRQAQLTQSDSLRVCGAAGCTSGWTKPWKSYRRPVFEDSWGCSNHCLQTIVLGSVRRELGGSEYNNETPHQHRIPLGLVLLAQGWITHPQLQHALTAQRAAGQGRIGEFLVDHCGLSEERIARGLGVQWNCPVLSLECFTPRTMALMMPKRFLSEFGMVPVRMAGSSILYVAFQQKMDASAALALEQMTGLKVECGLLPSTQFELAQNAIMAAQSVPVQLRPFEDADSLTLSIVKLLERVQPVASRLVRIHQYVWLRVWKEKEGRVEHQEAGMPDEIEDHIYTTSGYSAE